MKILGTIQSLVTSTTNMVMGGAGRCAFELYPSLPAGNAVMAPMNLSVVLALTYLGARGGTRDDMGRPLYLTEPWARHLAKEGMRLGMTGSLWHQPEVALEPAYLQELEGLKISARPLHRVAESGVSPLNAWVSAATGKNVTDFFPDRGLEDAQVMLATTLHVSLPWATPFQKSSSAGLMQYEGTLAFSPHEDFQLLRVGAEGGSLTVLFLLPRAHVGLNKIGEGLDYKTFSGWLKNLKDAPVSVSLPRFEVGSRLELSDGLRAMGQARSFTSGQADFTGLSPAPGLSLSRVINQTLVRVSEAGVEMATAAAAVFGPRAYVTDRAPETRPNHPFQFFVRDRASSAILAMGRGDRDQA